MKDDSVNDYALVIFFIVAVLLIIGVMAVSSNGSSNNNSTAAINSGFNNTLNLNFKENEFEANAIFRYRVVDEDSKDYFKDFSVMNKYVSKAIMSVINEKLGYDYYDYKFGQLKDCLEGLDGSFLSINDILIVELKLSKLQLV